MPEISPTLKNVVTVQEAAIMFYVSPKTIWYHLKRGNLVWRKSDRMALIDLSSLEALYGQPRRQLEIR